MTRSSLLALIAVSIVPFAAGQAVAETRLQACVDEYDALPVIADNGTLTGRYAITAFDAHGDEIADIMSETELLSKPKCMDLEIKRVSDRTLSESRPFFAGAQSVGPVETARSVDVMS